MSASPIGPVGTAAHALARGWRLCAMPAGQVVEPSALPVEADWQPLPDLMPVAAACAEAGRVAPEGGFDSVDWWYQCRLPESPPLASRTGDAQSDAWRLAWPGLATLAEVWLDDVCLLHSDNQFLAGEVPLGPPTSWAGRTLTLVFRSLDLALQTRRPRPSWKAPMVRNQQMRWLRASLFGRTPSWTPNVPLIGPTGPVSLLPPSGLQVTHWRLQSDWLAPAGSEGSDDLSSPGVGVLHLQAQGRADVSGWQLSLRLRRGSEQHVHALPLVEAPDGQWHMSCDLTLEAVTPWWPHTHAPQGQPALYEACLLWSRQEAGQGLPPALTQELAPIGFRHVSLETADADGRADFCLKVNGRPVFARGASMLPPDPLRFDLSEQAWREALQPYVDGGMNMLRLPGNIVYGSEAFYRGCDALGLMVWQEFMFSNMDYPGDDPAFQAGVRREVEAMVPRLASHPSLTVLCGNSEVSQQALMYAAPRGRWAPALFHELMPAWLREWGLSVPYWPSSVHGGSFPCRADVGTTSYYGVGVFLRPLEDARRSGLRFATECLAFSNEPMEPVANGWVPNDPAITGNFAEVRDHYLREMFKVDSQALAAQAPQRYLDMNRVASAEVMAAAFEEWRRDSSACRGALIWFGRDVQPGAGFGILDHAGHPKAPYHTLRRALQPRALSFSDEGCNGLFLHAINETHEHLTGHVSLTLYRADGQRADAGQLPLTAKPWSCTTLPLEDAFEWFIDLSWAYRFGPPVAHVMSARWLSADGQLLAEHIGLPAGRDLPLQEDLGWQVSLLPHAETSDTAGVGPQAVTLQLQAQRFAQSVLVDAPGWVADDQAFHVLPGEPRAVTLRAAVPAPARVIEVRALNTLVPLRIDLDALT